MIRNHSKSGLLGSEFRLPFGELLGGDFAGLFRINLRKTSFERLGELGRLLRRRVDGQDEFATDLFRLEAELLVDPEKKFVHRIPSRINRTTVQLNASKEERREEDDEARKITWLLVVEEPLIHIHAQPRNCSLSSKPQITTAEMKMLCRNVYGWSSDNIAPC